MLGSVGECGAAFYFLGVRAVGAGPGVVVAVGAALRFSVWAPDLAPRPFSTFFGLFLASSSVVDSAGTRGVMDVSAFGAVGDGTTDDTAAIQCK